jgi:hypothetical protein
VRKCEVEVTWCLMVRRRRMGSMWDLVRVIGEDWVGERRLVGM